MTGYRLKFGLVRLLAAAAVLCVVTGGADAQTKRLPVDAFAMEPAIDNVRVSPDGKHLAMLMGVSKGGKPILVIYETAKLGQKPKRIGSGDWRFQEFFWGNDDNLVVSMRQFYELDRPELKRTHKYIYRLASLNVSTLDWVELPYRKRTTGRSSGRSSSVLANLMMNIQYVEIISRLPADDDHILIAFDNNVKFRTDKYHRPYFFRDIFKINIRTGRMERMAQGNTRLFQYRTNRDGKLKFAVSFDLDTWDIIYLMRPESGDQWEEIYRFNIKNKESFEIVGDYLPGPDTILVAANNGRDKIALWSFDTKTKKIGSLIYGHPRIDVSNVVMSLKKGEEYKVVGYRYTEDIPRVKWIDQEAKALHARIDQALPGTYNTITSRAKGDKYMVVHADGPKEPGAYYLLKDGKQLEFIGRRLPLLTPDKLADVKMIGYKARDGLKIPAYLFTPKGKPPFPAIAMPHGGPWGRDTMTFDLWAQMLAHHGYMVLQPQFRGSFGFGVNLWRAGDAQWGLAMQDDVEDGMQHLVAQGLVDKNRMAIFGWSYGGYSAMVAATRNPNIFQCAIPGAGVSDITDLRAGLGGDRILREIQRPTIKGVSPLAKVADVNIPVLVIHGDEDERVNIEQSKKFVDGLKRHGKPHKFLVLKDANHFYGTIHYEHWMKMFPAMIDFLKKDCGPGGL